MANEKNSPALSPNYNFHRVAANAADVLPHSTRAHGMNMSSRRYALIQVVPSLGSNPDVKVQWWSDVVGEFIDSNPAETRSGVALSTPYEFVVECHGRVMFVAVTGGVAAGQHVDIYVSSFGIRSR